MPYDANGQWVEEPGVPNPSGFQVMWDTLTGRNKPAPSAAPVPGPPPAGDSTFGPFDPPAYRKQAGLPEEPSPPSKDELADLAKTAAEIARTEAQTRQIQQQIDAADSPAAQAKAEAELAVAQAQLKQITAEMERDAKAMSPEALARLQNELAAAREAAAREAAATEKGLDRTATATENQANRDFTAGQNEANLGARRDESNQAAGISIRGQEIDRLKAQDSWVLGLLQQQVAEGTLSLNVASKQFDAYVSRARLPSQIMESVGKAIEPMIPYMTNAKKGDSAPGFEKGGPMQQMVERSGGKYDPKAYAKNPVKVDMFDLAKRAGADFSKTSVPDPKKHFAGISVPKTDPNRVSAVSSAPAAPALLPGLAGSAQPAAAPAQSIPETMVPAAPSYAPTEEEMAQMQALLSGG